MISVIKQCTKKLYSLAKLPRFWYNCAYFMCASYILGFIMYYIGSFSFVELLIIPFIFGVSILVLYAAEMHSKKVDMITALQKSRSQFCDGDVLRHFKGHYYVFLGEVKDATNNATTKEDYVLYMALDGENENKKFLRKKSEFYSLVDKAKYPDVKQMWRFEKVKPDAFIRRKLIAYYDSLRFGVDPC